MDGVRATDRLYSCFRKSEALNLSFLNQVLHRAGHVFDRHVRIDAMLIEEIDVVGLQSLERGFGHVLDVVGPAIGPALLVTLELEPKLGRNHHLITHGCERFAQKFFVFERAVSFGGIEECNTAFYGRSDQRDRLLLIGGWTVTIAKAHTAKP